MIQSHVITTDRFQQNTLAFNVFMILYLSSWLYCEGTFGHTSPADVMWLTDKRRGNTHHPTTLSFINVVIPRFNHHTDNLKSVCCILTVVIDFNNIYCNLCIVSLHHYISCPTTLPKDTM